MFHLFAALLMITAATAVVVFAFVGSMFTWLSAGVAVLLCTKGLRSLLIFFRKSSGRIIIAHDLLLLMGGYLLSAIFFLASGVSGEGWLGFIATPVMVFVALVFWFASHRLGSSAAK